MIKKTFLVLVLCLFLQSCNLGQFLKHVYPGEQDLRTQGQDIQPLSTLTTEPIVISRTPPIPITTTYVLPFPQTQITLTDYYQALKYYESLEEINLNGIHLEIRHLAGDKCYKPGDDIGLELEFNNTTSNYVSLDYHAIVSSDLYFTNGNIVFLYFDPQGKPIYPPESLILGDYFSTAVPENIRILEQNESLKLTITEHLPTSFVFVDRSIVPTVDKIAQKYYIKVLFRGVPNENDVMDGIVASNTIRFCLVTN